MIFFFVVVFLRSLRPPRTTRTDTLFPYTTLFRSVTYGSCCRVAEEAAGWLEEKGISAEIVDVQTLLPFDIHHVIAASLKKTSKVLFLDEDVPGGASRSEEHTSELQSLMRISYAVFCLKKKNNNKNNKPTKRH